MEEEGNTNQSGKGRQPISREIPTISEEELSSKEKSSDPCCKCGVKQKIAVIKLSFIQ